MSYIISTENTCDFTPEMFESFKVEHTNLTFMIDNKELTPEESKVFTLQTFYNAMRAGSATNTSMINQEVAKIYLEKLLEKGQDVLHISFASVLSGTYESFKHAAEELNTTHDNKVYVVDSKAESGGQGLLVTLVCQKRDEGATIEEAYEYANIVRDHCMHYFVVDDLKYLARGGRLSKGAAFFGNMLNIKPVLHTDEEGRLIPIGKVFSRKLSLTKLVSKMKARYNKESDIVYITHGDAQEDAQFVADRVKEELGLEAKILPLDFVIGAHSGPGTIALFFTGDTRKE